MVITGGSSDVVVIVVVPVAAKCHCILLGLRVLVFVCLATISRGENDCTHTQMSVCKNSIDRAKAAAATISLILILFLLFLVVSLVGCDE